MSFLSSVLRKVAPIAAAIPSPIQPYAAAVTAGQRIQDQQKLQKDFDAQQKIRANKLKEIQNMEFDLPNSYPTFNPPQRQPTVQQQSGFGSGFSSFITDVGRNIINPLSGIFSQVRPMITQQSAGQPALATKSTTGGQESQQSGTQQAFMGGFGNVIGQAARLLKTPAGQVGVGSAVGIGAALMGPDGQKIRITRKMKAQYRAVLNLNMGNYDMAADMIGVSPDFFISVLLKRFRNDGPVVTKAALRKTKRTVRRLKDMCDMYDSLRPTATRRRSPMKRASTTLISNK